MVINENTPNGQVVGTVVASDPDPGQEITFSILSGNVDNAFLINENTGALSVNNTAALDYETNPTFSVQIQVQDNGPGALTDQATLTINLIDQTEIPEAAFTANATIIVAGESISFQDESLNSPSNWAWQFQGGTPTVSMEQNPEIVYETPGTYDVILSVSNTTGNDVLVMTDYVEVLPDNNMPVANFSSSVTNCMAGESITFYDQSLNSVTNRTWQFEGGTPVISFEENPVVTYENPGIYNVSLLVSNSFGSDVKYQFNCIEVVNNTYPPVAGFTCSSTTINVGESISFFDQSLNTPDNWMWQLEGAATIISLEQNPVVTYNTPGIFNVNLFVSSPYGTDILTIEDHIEVIQTSFPPLADFTSNVTTVVAGDPVYFYDQSQNDPTGWIWQLEGGTPPIAFEENPVTTYNTPGKYNVTLVASNSYGNDYITKNSYINVLPNTNPPVAEFIASTTTAITYETISFYDKSSNLPMNWMWQFEGGTPIVSFEQNPNIEYHIPGTYTVTLVATNDYGTDVMVKTDFIEIMADSGQIVYQPEYPLNLDEVDLMIYPNPASDHLYFDLTEFPEADYELIIFSLYGNQVEEDRISKHEGKDVVKIDIGRLEKGTFIIQVSNGQTVKRKKFIKL